MHAFRSVPLGHPSLHGLQMSRFAVRLQSRAADFASFTQSRQTSPSHGAQSWRAISHASRASARPGRSLPESAWLGLLIIGFWVTMGLFGPFLSPRGESETVTDVSFAPAG